MGTSILSTSCSLMMNFNPFIQCRKNTDRNFLNSLPKSDAFLLGDSIFHFLHINFPIAIPLSLSFSLHLLITLASILPYLPHKNIINEPNYLDCDVWSEMFVQAFDEFGEHFSVLPVAVVIHEECEARLAELFFELLVDYDELVETDLLVAFQDYLRAVILGFLQGLEYLEDSLFDNGQFLSLGRDGENFLLLGSPSLQFLTVRFGYIGEVLIITLMFILDMRVGSSIGEI